MQVQSSSSSSSSTVGRPTALKVYLAELGVAVSHAGFVVESNSNCTAKSERNCPETQQFSDVLDHQYRAAPFSKQLTPCRSSASSLREITEFEVATVAVSPLLRREVQ